MFEKLLLKYTPDPFVLALLLSAFVFVTTLLTQQAEFSELVMIWGNGLWGLLSFTLQMAMVLLLGFVLASSKPIQFLFTQAIKNLKSPLQALLFVSLVSMFASWLNWGFGLVVGALLAKEVCKQVSGVSHRWVVAAAYAGFLVWHGGLSGSIPLSLNTPGHFLEEKSGLIPVAQTLFSSLNFLILIGLLFFVPATVLFFGLKEKSKTIKVSADVDPVKEKIQSFTGAEKLERSNIFGFVCGAVILFYVVLTVVKGKFNLDLNTINTIYLGLGLLFHRSIYSFLKSVVSGAPKVASVLIQYPLYGGIMAMITVGGLGVSISQFFVDHSTNETFYLMSFFSAGLINIFVPSGGGQWAVQGPIVLEAASQLNLEVPVAAMAVAWGDAWTNMAQPFWALPVLAITGLKLKDILGPCLIVLLVSGVWISLAFFGYASIYS